MGNVNLQCTDVGDKSRAAYGFIVPPSGGHGQRAADGMTSRTLRSPADPGDRLITGPRVLDIYREP